LIAASLTFLTPWGALLALTAVVPLAALALAGRRERRARELLGLRAPAAARRWLRPLLVAAVLGLLGLAATQPVLRSTTSQKVRTDSEAFFVIDVSRSMLASRTPSSSRRIARARADAIRLRQKLLDVPSGVAALTDHVLPYLMPVADAGIFEQTVNRAVAVGQPPPATNSVTATNLGSLGALGTQSFFSPAASHRVAIVLTDGESRPFDQRQTAQALGRVTPVFIRIGGTDESVYDSNGQPESGYHADPEAGLTLSGLAQAAGGKAFGESQLGAAASAVRSALGSGPVHAEGLTVSTRALAPYIALAALVPLLALVGAFALVLRAARGTREREGTTALPSRSASPARS
jgi:hypothetical protein